MKKAHIFFANVLILTASSIVIQSILFSFNAFLSQKIGAEGMGLYHIIMSIYGVAVSFATSGINLAVTKLTAQNKINKDDVIKSATLYAMFFGTLTFIILYFNSGLISKYILKDSRTSLPIKILSISMPFIGLSAMLNGYFTAKKQVIKTAFSQLFELFIKILITTILLYAFGTEKIEHSCILIFTGGLIGEISSFILLLYLYKPDTQSKAIGNKKALKDIVSISLPLAVSVYIRSALNTIKQTMVPKSLQRYGLSYSDSLSNYGMINGMVMPILTFPMNILYSCSNLLIPEIAESIGNNNARVKKIVKKSIYTTTVFAIIIFVLCVTFSYKISDIIYNDNCYGKYILIMSPIIITMYVDAVCDGILKALDLQIYSMKLNIADSFICVILIYFLVSKYGIYGYILTIYISEIFNTGFSIYKLSKTISKY